MQKRRLAILGSTGSIGTQALDVVSRNPDLFQVELLTARNNADLLIEQAVRFDAGCAIICNPDLYDKVNSALSPHGIKVFKGMDSICSMVGGDNIDMVLNALVGFSGVRPTVAALEAEKPIALANKETLVAAGQLVMDMSREKSIPILPVDSEHSAIFQCLLGAQGNKVVKLHLTASGGPFRTWKKEDIDRATPSDALKHPRWTMGSKITIDSATMMNKGFEMIEAKWLFGVAPEDINIVVHPQSIIHSMVEFEDGAVIAQMGHPDMREPIQLALAFPRRLPLDNEKLDFAALGGLTFETPDTEKFPCINLAFDAIRRGGNIPCAMNAANEAAVAAFLEGRLPFHGIRRVIEEVMDEIPFARFTGVGDAIETNREALAMANYKIGSRIWS
mgnify:CR=1 FL=1